MKQKSAIITTPYPSVEEVRVCLGVSKKHAKKLMKIVNAVSTSGRSGAFEALKVGSNPTAATTLRPQIQK